MDALRATMDTLDGVVITLTVEGLSVAETWGITTPSQAVEALREHARATGQPVWLAAGTEPIDEIRGTQATFAPDGSWWPEAQDETELGSASLTHEIHYAIPPGEDLYKPDAFLPTDGTATADPDEHLDTLSPGNWDEEVADEQSDPPGEPDPSQNRFDLDGIFGDDDVDVSGSPGPVDDSPVEPVLAAGPTTHPAGGSNDTHSAEAYVPDVNEMSHTELEEWVGAAVLNDDHATSGRSSIRTRSAAPSTGPKPIVIAAVLTVALVCVVSLSIAAFSGDGSGGPTADASASPLTGAYALSPVGMETSANPPKETSLPGFEQAWNIKVPSGASVAATAHAVVVGTRDGITLRSPETGVVIGGGKAKGKVEAILSATLRNARGGGQIPVVAWKQGNTVTVYRVDATKQPLHTLALPRDAEVSSRGGGLLVTQGDRAGVVVLTEHIVKPKKGSASKPSKGKKNKRKKTTKPTKRTRVHIDWIEDPPQPEGEDDGNTQTATAAFLSGSATPATRKDAPSAAKGGLWAYAATPGGDMWWLHSDGTAHLPTSSGTRAVEMIRPRSGLRFAGWVGASIDASTGTAGALVAVWADPATQEMQLVTHEPETGEPVSAVATPMTNVQGGVSGTRSSHLSVGPYLVNAENGRIVVDGGEDYRVVGVAGEIASVRKPDGTVGVVNLGWIRPDEDIRVYPTQGRPLGAGTDGSVIFQMPGSQVTGYAPAE
ncbi:MAG: hypothetical protein L0H93_17210 [Nocardioides sp.]|nr:hypothetical protein [Nocardioides sp.]